MSAAERAYRLLLRAYPPRFRTEYGREMVLLFRDRRRDAAGQGLRFWWEMIRDVARSAPALRFDAFRLRWDGDIRTGEEKMRTMAILAVLIGVAEAANALAEGWAGGFANGGFWLAGIILTVVAGTLLVVAGVAMLRCAPGAVRWARAAAIMCLTVVVLIRLAHGWMSIFGTLLGIAFPIALLLFLWWTRRRRPSAPSMA